MTSLYDRRYQAEEDQLGEEGTRGAPGKRTLTQHLPPRADAGDHVGEADQSGLGFLASAPVAKPHQPDDPFFFGRSAGEAPPARAIDAAARIGLGDVSGVRLHTDAAAHAVASTHDAHAVAFGQDIAFGAGAYEPGTAHGDQLLGHELAHTAQQRGAAPLMAAKARTSTPGDASEVEADMAGESFLASLGGREVAPIRVTSTPATVARFAGAMPVARPAYVTARAPLGNQNARGPQPGDLVGRRQAAEGARRRGAGQAQMETPTLTIRPGGTPPTFVTVSDEPAQTVQGPDPDSPHNVYVDYSPRLFHAIEAIKFDVRLARSIEEIDTLWTLYLLDASQPAPWSHGRRAARSGADRLTAKIPTSDDEAKQGWEVPYGDRRLPGGAAASAIQWGLVDLRRPNDDPGGGVRRAVLLAAVRARAADVEELQEWGAGPAAGGATDDDARTREGPRAVPTLILPLGKADHLGRYQQVANERRLVHDPKFKRKNPKQADKWRAEMAPGKSDGITAGAYADGVDLMERTGRKQKEIIIPHWSPVSPQIDMDVDHVIELQLTLASDRGWANSIANFELLEEPANSSSGSLIDSNIENERQRLFTLTGDMKYIDKPLYFERVIVGPGIPGSRWTPQQVRMGVHLQHLRAMLGLLVTTGQPTPGRGTAP